MLLTRSSRNWDIIRKSNKTEASWNYQECLCTNITNKTQNITPTRKIIDVYHYMMSCPFLNYNVDAKHG